MGLREGYWLAQTLTVMVVTTWILMGVFMRCGCDVDPAVRLMEDRTMLSPEAVARRGHEALMQRARAALALAMRAPVRLGPFEWAAGDRPDHVLDVLKPHAKLLGWSVRLAEDLVDCGNDTFTVEFYV